MRIAEFPGLIIRAATAAAGEAKARQALTFAIATLIEDDREIPPPRDDRRPQVNIRLTPDQRDLLEQAARRGGHKGLSDYIRTVVLAHAQEGTKDES